MIVEESKNGVYISGCKMHQTGTVNAHWMIVMPGCRMIKGEESYAIACAIPVNAKGLTYVLSRQSSDLRSMYMTREIDLGNAKYGGQECIILFDRVFIPHKYIFLKGEIDYCDILIERFTSFHRRSYICKAGLGDVLLGASAGLSQYHNTFKKSHIQDKLIEMSFLNETIAGTAIAASYQSVKTDAGGYIPDVILSNVCKHHVTKVPFQLSRIAQDIAGGLVSTLPSQIDYEHPEYGYLLKRYTKATGDEEERRRLLRLVENMTMGRNAVGYLTESIHGAGSPQAQRIIINKYNEINNKINIAKRLAGINISKL